jgi:hypothetical protein
MPEPKKLMSPREILTEIMKIESINMSVHETRMVDVGGHLKPSNRITGIGVLILSSDFKRIEVIGELTNCWVLNQVNYAEYDEVDKTLYLHFKNPNHEEK